MPRKLLLATMWTLTAIAAELQPGWNLIGAKETINLAQLTSINFKVVWIYEKTTHSWKGYSPDPALQSLIQAQGYPSFESIEQGAGFWLYTDTPVQFPDSNDSFHTYAYTSGWTLLGTTAPLSLSTLPSDITLVWSFDNENKRWVAYTSNSDLFSQLQQAGYTTISSLPAGIGFWIYSTSNGSFSINSDTLNPVIANRGYTLLAWNDLGMHCMDADYSIFSILPPYNTIDAHLIKQGTTPQKVTTNVTLTYEAYPYNGTLNSFSDTKTNFWQFVQPLYGLSLEPNIGFHGLPTPSTIPEPLVFDTTHQWWAAEGIPITPFDDDGSYNPYPLVKITAKDLDGNVLAQTVTVVPVSTEMDCRACHGSNSGYDDAKPLLGWVDLNDSEKDYRFNILRLHDQKHPNAVSTYQDALAEKGYTYLPEGLEATATAGTPILCAACHKSNALPGTGIDGIPPLTQAIHSKHALVKDPQTGALLNDIENTTSCYMCHPGQNTQCLRGAMGSNGISCQDCHGTMSAVGSDTREGWLDEPNCQSCHQNGMRYTTAVTDKLTGTLREALDTRFATTPNVPVAGKSLYRYSKGHGDLSCSACHGSTHAIYPSSHYEDNLQSIGVQGHAGTIAECSSCHSTMPLTANEGPHGLHSIGDWWVEEHGEYVESNNATSCAACHGNDYMGSDLSKTFSARTFNTEYGTKTYPAGAKVSCYDCHNGPDGGED